MKAIELKNYKAVVSFRSSVEKCTGFDLTVVGKAANFMDAVKKIQHRFVVKPDDTCTIHSMECLGKISF